MMSTFASASSGSSSLLNSLDELSLDPAPVTGARQQALREAVHALEGTRFTSQERTSPPVGGDPQATLLKFIEHLLDSEHADTEPQLIAVGYELEALISIYPSSVKLSFASRPPSFVPPPPPPASEPPSSALMEKKRSDSKQWTDALWDNQIGYTPGERIRYEIQLPIWEEGDSLDGLHPNDIPESSPMMRVLVSLPPTYPNSSPPQLQLLGRYLGSFSIDSGLFGDITRTYISSNAVPFIPGDVCVFEGLTHVQTLARKWYISHLAQGAEGERAREEERKSRRDQLTAEDDESEDTNHNETQISHNYQDLPTNTILDEQNGNYIFSRPSPSRSTFSYSIQPDALSSNSIYKPKIYSSEPIIDRKSSFIGHAIRVDDERQVPLVIHELLSDKKISKAAHPAIFAFRIAKDVGGAAGKNYNTDYDDDGESQAGARLKHLLEILELENVLIVVSRWYGGTLLGPDRFKHINQAARDALDLAGFLEEKKEKDKDEGKKRRK